MEVEVGDYLLTKEKRLFRIMMIHTDTTGTYYDIKSYEAFIENSHKFEHQYIKAIPRNKFRHLGKVIPEAKVTKTLKILYG